MEKNRKEENRNGSIFGNSKTLATLLFKKPPMDRETANFEGFLEMLLARQL